MRYPNNDSSTTKNLDGTSDYDRSIRKPIDPPDPLASLDLSFIAKGILYICLTIVAIVFVNSCQVDEETIKQCETSCSSQDANDLRSVLLDNDDTGLLEIRVRRCGPRGSQFKVKKYFPELKKGN